MKTTILSLLFTFLISNSFAQTETAAYKTVADKFELNYNNNNYDSIFSMFDAIMQNALPLEKTIEFLTGLKAQVGQIKNKQFIKYIKGTVAVYKTNFENTLFALNISLDKSSKINGLFVGPYADETQPKLLRNATKLILPFKDEWTVIWGGDTEALNYHVVNPAQKNAFDIIITDAKGNSYKTDGKTNEDYYAFGKELIAPCDGEIVLVVDGVKDNVPGEMNKFNVGGNTVIIKTANNEYLVLCHFKHQSIKVKEGQKIKQGELLGLCGNTGNSSEAHLHFHIQNIEDLNTATGVKCYFEKISVNEQVKQDYSPIKNEKIKN
jgi:murein DD-endopeptidase MepM/ murein hydrolase activator NlpD